MFRETSSSFGRLTLFSTDSGQQRLDVTDAGGPGNSWAVDHGRDVVCDHSAAEVHFINRFHEFEHVRVTVVDNGLHESRDWPTDIAKVNLPELIPQGSLTLLTRQALRALSVRLKRFLEG